MKISFENIYWLSLIPAAIFFAFYGVKKGGFNERFASGVRFALMLLLILSLCGVSAERTVAQSAVAFVLDLSQSAQSGVETAIETLKNAAKQGDEKEAVIVFGDGFSILQEPSEGKTDWSVAQTKYKNNKATNIEQALKAAADMENVRRIALISDGAQTEGDAEKAALNLRARGVTVDVLPIKNSSAPEIQLSEINLPKKVGLGSRYDITVVIDANERTTPRLKLYKNGSLISDDVVSVEKGKNVFSFADTGENAGGVIYRAEIEPQSDTIIENNSAYAYSYTGDAPSILILSQSDEGQALSDILADGTAKITLSPPNAAPVTLAEMATYSLIILDNADYYSLPKGFTDNVKEYVEGMGGGVMATGGENAFALGGYANTVLEEILPVSMQIDTKGDNANLGLMLAIDRSGSMSSEEYGVSKQELAKEAVIRSAEALTEKDKFGVLAFDDGYNWAVEFENVTDKKLIAEKVSQIQPGGGTSILPALKEAAETLANAETKLKHIILLTDGQAETTGYDSVINAMNRSGITLSTISIGSDADEKLLKSLAQKGNGRYYHSDAFTSLPEIFLKETMIAGKDYINNKKFLPKISSDGNITKGIERLKPLNGYIRSSAKPLSEQILLTEDNEPLLAVTKKGLGKTVAWTSDLSQTLSNGILSYDEGAELIKNAASYALKNNSARQIDVKASGEEITLKTPADENIESIEAYITDEKGVKTELKLLPKAVGEYAAKFETAEAGAYIVNAIFKLKDGNAENASAGFATSYSKELDMRNDDGGLSEAIARLTGGSIIQSPDDIYKTKPTPYKANKDLTDIFLWLATIVFAFDVAVRRFPIITDKAREAFEKICGWIKSSKRAKISLAKKEPSDAQKGESKPIDAQNETIDILLKSKKQ